MTDESQPSDPSKWAATADVSGRTRAAVRASELMKLPQELGRYTLIERLGAGGMAEVFLATQDGPAGFSKKVVVKRIHNHLAQDPRFVEMFRREATIVARIHHANVVQVYELGEEEGLHFIAMEFIDGLSLNRMARRAWRNQRSVPTEVILGAIADAAAGLHHAHTLKDAEGNESGIIHRDISPENLMMGTDGITKVLDFGIARSTQSSATKTGELKGKLPFMAPEQIRTSDLTPKVDLYALGVTAYWLLTGQLPLVAETDLMMLQEVLTVVPDPPSTVNPKLPDFLDDLCLALLEKDPANRPESAQVVHELLAPLAPWRGQMAAPYLKEILEMPDTGGGDEDGRNTSGFVPSMPHAGDLQVEWKQLRSTKTQAPDESGSFKTGTVDDALPAVSGDELDELLPPEPAWRRYAPMVGAGAFALLFLIVIVAFASDGDAGDDLDPPDVGHLQPPDDSQTPPDGETDETGETDDNATPPDNAADENDPDNDEATADDVEEAADDPPDEKTVKDPPPRRRAPRMASLKTKGPAGLVWLDERGRRVGKGSGSLRVRSGTDALYAVDPKTGGKSRVRVEGGVADYTKVGRGRLDIRALPYADVNIGSLKLGVTPFGAQSMTAGRYRVTLTFEGKTVTRTANVRAGRLERVTVDFRK